MPPDTTPASLSGSVPKQRLTIYTAHGRDGARRIAAVQQALEETYLRTRKRKLPAGLDLFWGSSGPRERPTFTLTAHYTPDMEPEVAFLQSEAAKSPVPPV